MKPKYLWFKISILLGFVLGLLLLGQTVLTYRYVRSSLVRQEAAREADRRLLSIGRAARLTGTREWATLTPVLRELVQESHQQIAWIRILNGQGKVLAQSDPVEGAPVYTEDILRRMFSTPQRRPEERIVHREGVLITLNPLRGGGPPQGRSPDAGRGAADGRGAGDGRGRGGHRPAPEFVEVAVYLAGVSAKFGMLRENLVLGCTAAFALLAAVIIIGLRFPGYMHGKHIEEELSLARRVQTDLFPSDTSTVRHLAFAARCVPAWQVGGDLYDVFDTDDGEVALLLGDVSGKGLPAALLMGVVQGAVRASCGTGAAANHEQATERLNQLLCMKTALERFVSLFWCYADQRHGVLHYVNAGHLPPLLVRHDGVGPKVIRLDEGGPVLGLLPEARYQQATVTIQPGDLLVLFSDGILEAANVNDEEFGEGRVIAAIERNWLRPPADICAAILADVKVFLGKEVPQDDQTLLVVRLDEVAPNPPRLLEKSRALTG
ncbi:MAG: PP2C family protein-serine/threonine phosphatase [Terriglobia bacterium]